MESGIDNLASAITKQVVPDSEGFAQSTQEFLRAFKEMLDGIRAAMDIAKQFPEETKQVYRDASSALEFLMGKKTPTAEIIVVGVLASDFCEVRHKLEKKDVKEGVFLHVLPADTILLKHLALDKVWELLNEGSRKALWKRFAQLNTLLHNIETKMPLFRVLTDIFHNFLKPLVAPVRDLWAKSKNTSGVVAWIELFENAGILEHFSEALGSARKSVKQDTVVNYLAPMIDAVKNNGEAQGMLSKLVGGSGLVKSSSASKKVKKIK